MGGGGYRVGGGSGCDGGQGEKSKDDDGTAMSRSDGGVKEKLKVEGQQRGYIC